MSLRYCVSLSTIEGSELSNVKPRQPFVRCCGMKGIEYICSFLSCVGENNHSPGMLLAKVSYIVNFVLYRNPWFGAIISVVFSELFLCYESFLGLNSFFSFVMRFCHTSNFAVINIRCYSELLKCYKTQKKVDNSTRMQNGIQFIHDLLTWDQREWDAMARCSSLIECFHRRDQWACFPTDIRENVCIKIDLDGKRSSGWLESWEGLLFATAVSATCAEAIFRVKW